jgi:hypothetical protein
MGDVPVVALYREHLNGGLRRPDPSTAGGIIGRYAATANSLAIARKRLI